MVDFDPRDSCLFVNGQHDAVFSQLRARGSLHVDNSGPVPVYSLVRYADVSRAYKEPEVFSPCAGLTLDAFDPAACDTPSKMLEMAPPDLHRALRGAMLRAFRGDDLASLAEKTHDLLEQFVLTVPGGEVVDFVDDFAQEVASTTTSVLLGLEPAEASRLDPLFCALGAFDADMSPESATERQKFEFWLLRELTRVVRAHSERERSGGLIATLLAAEAEGRPLSKQEVVLNCLNVVVAGTGAMQHALAGALALWIEQAVDLESFATEPERTRSLIDETLRWLTPVVHLTRILTQEVEISGQPVPRGSGMCLWNVSANRDEEIFDDPTAFKPDRTPGRHLAFGAGPQHCLGAQLVQAQLGHLLSGIAEHGVRFEPGGSPTWMRSNTITGVKSLPVRIRRKT